MALFAMAYHERNDKLYLVLRASGNGHGFVAVCT